MDENEVSHDDNDSFSLKTFKSGIMRVLTGQQYTG
jgi:hypothetical protein